MSNFDEELQKLNKQNEEKFQDAIKKIARLIPTIITICIAIWWMFYGTLKIEQFSFEVIASNIGLVVCSVVLSITMCELIAGGGYDSGKQSKRYVEAKNKHTKMVQLGLSKQKQILRYANAIAISNLKESRTTNLASNGLFYEDYFDKDGNYIGGDYKHNHKLKSYQRRIIKKCIHQKVVLPSIFGDISSKYFGLKKEITQSEYRAKTSAKNIIIRSLLAFISASVVFEFIGFSITSLIFAFFQIVLWVSSGLIQRINNFNFVVDTLASQLEERTLIIESYFALSDIEKQKYEEIIDIKTESEVINNGE